MRTEKKHPNWWQLYVGLPVLVGLFWPEMRAALTEPEHVIAEIGILFLVFGFVHLWLRANRSALMDIDPADAGWRITLYEVPVSSLRSLDDHEDRAGMGGVLQMPTVEIKGVLGDTFEWDAPEDEASVFAHRSAVPRKD